MNRRKADLSYEIRHLVMLAELLLRTMVTCEIVYTTQ